MNSIEHGVANTTFILGLIAPPHSGTLLDCSPTQPKDVGQCKPIRVLCAMQRLVLTTMTFLLQLRKG